MKTWKRAFAFAAAIAAGAAESARADLQYLDETGATATVQSYTAVEESDYIWSTGWYAVTNNVTVETRADGHAVVECPLDADESLRSASFFLPSISLCPPKMTIDSLSSHIIVVKPISSSSTKFLDVPSGIQAVPPQFFFRPLITPILPDYEPPAPVVEQ